MSTVSSFHPVTRALELASTFIGKGLGFARARLRVARTEELDDRFHAAYDERRAEHAQATPILVLIEGKLVLLHGTAQREYPASDPVTKIIQAAAHAPVGAFAVLHELSAGQPLTAAARARLAALRLACKHARSALRELRPGARDDVRSVLERSQAFIDSQLASARLDPDSVKSFARDIGPLLLALTGHATELELAALDAAVDNALASLSEAEVKELEVVVTGAHQARARSLGMQYFQKRFGEQPGEERRVAYAEATGDVEEARTLVGTRRLDRVIARAFFEDERRLQRDVLGDAAEEAIEHRELSRIR